MKIQLSTIWILCALSVAYSPPGSAQRHCEFEPTRFSLGVDLYGWNRDTKNVSLQWTNKLCNKRVIQFAETRNGELGKGSKFSGSSVSYLYKDYFSGLLDGDKSHKANRLFMITGAGFGDFRKTDYKTEEKTHFNGIFLSFGIGGDHRILFDDLKFSWTLGVALGGTVTKEALTGGLLYEF